MIIADTGIFISAADRSEPSHHVCAELLRSHSEIVVPAKAWLIADRLGPIVLIHDRANLGRLASDHPNVALVGI